MLRLCKGEGSEVRGGEQLTSVSLLVLELLNSFIHFFFFHVPKLRANGKAALCLPECSQCIQFPVQKVRARKQKQTGSEGRGKWEVTEVRA